MAGVSRGTFAGRLGEAIEQRARAKNTLGDLAGSLRELEASLQGGEAGVKELLKEVPNVGSPEVKAELAVPLRKFAEARALLIGLSQTEKQPTNKKRAEAHREYFETRNELLFRAVRIHQRKFPLREDGGRGDEYRKLLDALFTNFITDESLSISKSIHAPTDAAYSLALDPELLREFKTQILDFYDHATLPGIEGRKELMESILLPDLEQLEAPLRDKEKNALREARLAYASSKIAAAEGVPHMDARAIEKRYRELRVDALLQVQKMKESSEEDNDWMDELGMHAVASDIALETRLREAKLSAEKRKRVSRLAQSLSKAKWGRNTLALLAIFAAVSKDAPDVDVTPLHRGAPTEDVQSPRAQAPAERTDESSASVSVAIPEGGNALTALKDVVVASNRVSWITPWMEMVRQNARPDLALTREGRLEALAMNLGFMTDYTRLDRRTGAYVADSMPIPKGSTLVLDESGMRLIYNGREEQLVTVTEGPDGNILTVHPYAGMYP